MPQSTTDVFARHRDLYKEMWEAQQRVAELGRELAEARSEIVVAITENLKKVPGIAKRLPDPDEVDTTTGAGMVMQSFLPDADPINDVVLATESRYFEQLGGVQATPPLAIWHVNNITEGGEIECPHCGETINHKHDLKVPKDAKKKGAVGRGAGPGRPLPRPTA